MAKPMTVSELRQKLRGLPADMPVYLQDHDHSRYEVNGSLTEMEVVNRENAHPEDEIGPYKIEGDYLVLRTG